MMSEVPDAVALNDRIRDCETRRTDFVTLLSLVSKYHLNERYSGLSEYLLSQAEIAGNEQLSIIRELVGDRTADGRFDAQISLELAAQMLGVSAKTVYRLERNPRKMREMGWPGRNVPVKVFSDWATPLRTARLLRKAARERTRSGHFCDR